MIHAISSFVASLLTDTLLCTKIHPPEPRQTSIALFMINSNRFLLFSITILVLFPIACKWMGHQERPNPNVSINPKPNNTMPFTPLPVTGDYADDWKIVDSLEQQGLYKSAGEKVAAIQIRANNDKNSQQIVKCLLFQGKYTTFLEEDGLAKAIQNLEAESAKARQPEKSVLQSMLGQLYSTYLSNNAWNLGQRTPIPDGEGGDILTWSAAQVERHALELYDASIEQEALLKTVPFERFSDVLIAGRNDSIAGKPLHPSIFDLLAARALDHYNDERNYLTQPANAFVLNQDFAFAAWDVFADKTFENEDKESFKWRAVQLYQHLLKIYKPAPGSNDAVQKARLIEVDLKRLQFVHNNSTLENKDELYRKALESLKNQTLDHPSGPEVVYHLASHVYRLGGNDAGANARFAVSELEAAVKRFPDSYGARLCAGLLDEIKRANLYSNVEEVTIPEQPVLVLVNYKNLNKVYVRLIKTATDADPDGYSSEWHDRLLQMRAIQQRDWTVQDPGDYQQHSTEIYLEPVQAGNYWLVISSTPDFDRKKGVLTFNHFSSSNIAAVSVSENNRNMYVMADRMTGSPLTDVRVSFFRVDYNGDSRKLILAGNVNSDKNGLVDPVSDPDNYLMALAVRGKDSLWVGSTYSNPYGRKYRQPVIPTVQFFTDRSIYRPEQTVYFKGIIYQRDDQGMPKILPGQAVSVLFLDANGQKKGELKLRSNDFGTFNGSFAAPIGGLTGAMSIRMGEGASGQTFFNVEEYKRPRFEVNTKPVTGAYRLGDKITVKGDAKNYAGNAVDGASVHYRVVRRARFPYFDYFRKWIWPPQPQSDEQEITSGNTSTDANGEFSVLFEAIPDKSVQKKDQPVFDYSVYVDVTDITGETRSTETSISAAYAALQLDWNLTNETDLEDFKKIKITATNMSGEAQPTEGEITIQKLVAPGKIYIDRYWSRPDINTIPKVEFDKLFPGYAWKDEDDPATWGKQDLTRHIKFNTGSDETVDLDEGKTQPGWYVVKISATDQFGEKVEKQLYTRIFNQNTRFEKLDAALEKTTVEPGNKTRVLMGGQNEELRFFFARERDGQMKEVRWVQTNGIQAVDVPVEESDRGGISLITFAVKNNRFYSRNLAVTVPWSNKELNISFETFRDKLAPGQQEEWRIRISGPAKDKVAAEMVAAMYDASLDAFKPHGWSQIAFPYTTRTLYVQDAIGFHGAGSAVYQDAPVLEIPNRNFPELNWFEFPMWGRYPPGMALERSAVMADGAVMRKSQMAPASAPISDSVRTYEPEEESQEKEKVTSLGVSRKPEQAEAPKPSIRTNLNETVFFFPELRTDADGNIILKFTMNEALTRWKLLAFAHTKDLVQGLATKEVVTQKELMIIANPPRFLREGDEMEFSAKLSNLSKETLDGVATLNLSDASNMQDVNGLFGLAPNKKLARFSVFPGLSAAISWRIKVPKEYTGAVTWQITADGGKFKDGEESTIPVVSNRMLVTETMPISLRGGQTKKLVFENLKNANTGGTSTLSTQSFSLEFTSNPVWYAVQSLPYLMEYPHECSEQVFSRFYANTLASSVVDKMPQIKRVFERWKGTDAMKSNLSKNQELKSALLEETPWVLDAQSEEQQKQQIALLFDLNRMADERQRALGILAERQMGNGGWSWFPGGQPSWYITQHILSGMMHLQKLGAIDVRSDQSTLNMLNKATRFCDDQLNKQYAELERLAKDGKTKLEDDHLDGMAIQYLYMRSFMPFEHPPKEVAYNLGQAEKYWLNRGLYEQGMLALALQRFGNKTAATKIVASLRERALVKDELGMYWPVDWGFYWYQLPVETQALMVEVFGEVANDQVAVENLRIWLLKNKQTNRWESTKATAEAVYALLLFGDNWLNNVQPVHITIGDKALKVKEYEAGTGYFKQSWRGDQIDASWATITAENPNDNISWGAAYWQYFEDLDKIKSFQKTPLTIVKQLFLESDSPTGPVLKPVADGQLLHRGDKIKVRIEIRVDRAMEYVHLKDMRAAGFEPVNVLSGYKWQGNLGYYESTRDLATNFFIDYLPRGTFVFEYPLVVSLRGEMSNGVATMQCMYAPEFTTHSAGIRVRVE